jgi:hypothetical protein
MKGPSNSLTLLTACAGLSIVALAHVDLKLTNIQTEPPPIVPAGPSLSMQPVMSVRPAQVPRAMNPIRIRISNFIIPLLFLRFIYKPYLHHGIPSVYITCRPCQVFSLFFYDFFSKQVICQKWCFLRILSYAKTRYAFI